MTLRVMFHDQLLFEAGTQEGVLVPFDAEVRALTVQALTIALALLSGSKPHVASDTVEIESGLRRPQTARDLNDRVVVPFRGVPARPHGD